MPQDVDMIIEVRGGAGKKHLHLKVELNTISKGMAASNPLVNWRVSLDASPSAIAMGVTASSIGLTDVSVWFPYSDPVFVQAGNVPLKEVTIALAPTGTSVVPDSEFLGSVMLTFNTSFTLPTVLPKGKFAVPIGIYCTVDGGQNATPLPPPRDFHQRGRQMIDGKNSHPECNVGL